MNTVDINKAWNNLYNRLQQENLILSQKKMKSISALHYVAAVALFLILVATSLYITLQSGIETTDLLAKTNNETDNILVTTLEDGSTIYLSEHSSLFYPEIFAPDKRKVRIVGTVLFDVSSESKRPFWVETEQASVKVLGTSFSVTSTDNKTFELSVQRGKVEVFNKLNKESIIVEAEEMVRLQSNHFLKSRDIKTNTNTSTFTTFTQKMRFKDERLGDILKVIENTTGVNIILMDKSLVNRTLTVAFENNTPDSMIEILCFALNLKSVQKQDGIYISPS